MVKSEDQCAMYSFYLQLPNPCDTYSFSMSPLRKLLLVIAYSVIGKAHAIKSIIKLCRVMKSMHKTFIVYVSLLKIFIAVIYLIPNIYFY